MTDKIGIPTKAPQELPLPAPCVGLLILPIRQFSTTETNKHKLTANTFTLPSIFFSSQPTACPLYLPFKLFLHELYLHSLLSPTHLFKPEPSVLGPLLFSIYMSSQGSVIHKHHCTSLLFQPDYSPLVACILTCLTGIFFCRIKEALPWVKGCLGWHFLYLLT